MNFLKWISCGSVIGAAILLGACRPKHEPASGAPTNVQAAQVKVQTVETRPRTVSEEVVGTFCAKWRATLESRLSGRIETMPVRLGDHVQKGQVLARLDAAEMAARLEQAEAGLDEADRNWRRVSGLYEQHTVPRAEYDGAQTRQRAAKAAVVESKALMGYLELLAPFDGFITKKSVDVGDLATPGKPLLELENPSVLQLEADVPEGIAAHLKQDAVLTVQADGAGSPFEALVKEISPAADPMSRTLRVRLEVPPKSGLRSGQFARVAVPIREASSIRVPETALVRRGQLEMVFSMADHRARMHLVKTGRHFGAEVEILSGLEAGRVVVVSGAEHLTDGQALEAN